MGRNAKKRAAAVDMPQDAIPPKLKDAALKRFNKFNRCMCRLIPPTCTACDEGALQALRGRGLYEELMKQPTVPLTPSGTQVRGGARSKSVSGRLTPASETP